uniref:Tubulin domain-containing protein n=1 Tax=Macrostomum lignano TaxID=282301 RepID=A0A1I8FNW5_9PLAT
MRPSCRAVANWRLGSAGLTPPPASRRTCECTGLWPSSPDNCLAAAIKRDLPRRMRRTAVCTFCFDDTQLQRNRHLSILGTVFRPWGASTSSSLDETLRGISLLAIRAPSGSFSDNLDGLSGAQLADLFECRGFYFSKYKCVGYSRGPTDYLRGMKAAADAHLARKFQLAENFPPCDATTIDGKTCIANGALNLDPNNVMPNTRYPRIFYNKFDAHICCACVLRDMRSDGRVAVYEACSPDALQCTVLRPPPPPPPLIAACSRLASAATRSASRFWDLALREHAFRQPAGRTLNDSLGTFFRQQPARGSGSEARAVLVDNGEGVVGETVERPTTRWFRSFRADHGRVGSGVKQLGCRALRIRPQAPGGRCLSPFGDAPEQCDTALQCFFLLHSMGGGTGSAWARPSSTAAAGQYPKFVTGGGAVRHPLSTRLKMMTSITSPYNSVLAMRCLTDYADCWPNLLLNLTASAPPSPATRERGSERDQHEPGAVPPPALPAGPRRVRCPALPPRRAGSAFNRVVFGKERPQLFSGRAAIALYLACASCCGVESNLSDRRRCVDRLGNRLAFATGIPGLRKIGALRAVPPLASISRTAPSPWPTTLPIGAQA